MNDERLPDELRALGAGLASTPDREALAERVMQRVEHRGVAESGSARRGRNRKAVVAVSAALVAALVLAPAVRATVTDWFGVLVEPGEVVESDGEPVPDVNPELTIGEAADAAGFDPIVPADLGAPDGVNVSDDSRVVSMSWARGDGTVRLDEFEGTVSPSFLKRTPDVEFLQVGDDVSAVWFGQPHEVLPVTQDGDEVVRLARSAGPTLVWPVGELTLRLEGLDRDEAVAIAEAVLLRQQGPN